MATESPVYNGRYELVRQVARGGMAEVYLARDLLLDRPVALKVLFPELSVDRSFVARFRREAQAAANLSHPNIVPIFDWGEADRTYFIVMEYVDGHPLSSILKAEGPLPADRAAAIGAEVAAALAYAHRHGVIHRDVKPGNVLISNDGTVKVADFGIARAAGTDETLTQTGAVMGTATYFSPEQAQGKPVDARSDVYALGVVLYECVTGSPPFSGDNPVAIAYKHVSEEPVPPRELNPSLPPDFERIILHAMAKSPAARYQGADDLRADLLAFQQGRSVAAPPPTLVAAGAIPTAVQAAVGAPTARIPTAVGAPTYAEPYYPEEEEEERPARTGLYVFLLAVLLAATGVVVYLILSSLGVLSVTTKVTVPNVTNMSLSRAESVLKHDHLLANVHRSPHGGTPNTVYHQSPGAGAHLTRGSAVDLDVTTGPHDYAIPNEVGKSYSAAASALQAAGFKVRHSVQHNAKASGTVIGQNPTGSAPHGSTVHLLVSSGPAPVTVPSVSGDSPSQAGNILGQHGLNVGSTSYAQSSTISQGLVINTQPPAGQQVSPGTTVGLIVSEGPPTAVVPPVVGDTASQAQATLKNAGFGVSTTYRTVHKKREDGIVLSQSPSANQSVTPGTTVTLTVGRYTAPTTTTSSTTSTTSASTTTTTTKHHHH